MIAANSIRRATVFALIFGGAVGLIAWRAGGWRSKTSDDDASRAETAAPSGPVSSLEGGVGVGESADAKVSRERVKVIDGRACRFVEWTAAWAKAVPKKSPDPAVAVQDLVMPHVVLYPEPTSAAPAKAGDPSTTTATGKTGVLTYEKDVRTEVRLDGDVAVDRADPVRGGFRLRTPSLTCTMETHGETEKRHAQTAAAVAIDGGRAHIQGTGLDADLTGDACRATVLHDVKGRFDAQPGAISMTGGNPDAKSLPTDVTCKGACELASLDAAPRAGGRRWKATFHDDVHVIQGDDTLDCDLLEIEFKMGESKSDDGMPPQHGVATGHVRIKGATESRTYDVVCDKATHDRVGVVGKEVDVVVFEGSPVMNFYGPLSAASGAIGQNPAPKKKPDAAQTKGRMEIRCEAPAVMNTRRTGNLPTSPHRTSVVFEKNVVVKQWDDEKIDAVTGELRAQKATLYGTRLAAGPFQPDTLTTENGDVPHGPGVDLKRLDFASHSDAATWTRIGGTDVDHYMLVGDPVVNYAGVKALHPFGKAKTSPDSRVVVSSADNVTIDVYADRPPVAGEKQRPYATIDAGPRPVVVQTEAGVEVSRATADHDMRAIIAPGKQLEHLEANGNAHLWGKTDDGQTRDVTGARVVLDRLVLPPGAPKDAPHPSQVVALGDDKGAPAVAVVNEPNGDVDDVRADSLRYSEEGSVVFATGHVVVTIDAKSRAAKLAKVADGPIRITAGEARVDLAPDASKQTGTRKLRKVDAGGGVVIDGKIDRIEGKQLTFDAVTGIAEVRGPGEMARVVYSAESARYPSLLVSDLIRAYFDVSDDPAKNGQLVRVQCPGGGRIIRYLDTPDPATGKPAPGSVPRRIRIESKGPMESTRSEATAQDDVTARADTLSPSGDWAGAPMTFYCQRAHMTFDPDAPGRGRDRLRTFDAIGDAERQVVVETPDFFGRADHVELDAQTGTIGMSKTSEKDVYVREIASGRQLLYDGVVYHYDTHEWTDAVRMREVESR